MGAGGGSGGGRRGPAALVALVLLGVAAGYGASRASVPGSTGTGTAEPVVARSPRHPGPTPEPRRPEVVVPEGVAEDPDDAPLEPDVLLRATTLGTGPVAITYPVPAGWVSTLKATNEAKWKEPGTSNNTYVMRVEQITSQDLTAAEAMDLRIRELSLDQPGFDPVARGADSLEYVYISNENTFRHSFMRWVDLDADGKADVEVVVHGRQVDVPGARDLITEVAAGIRAGGP